MKILKQLTPLNVYNIVFMQCGSTVCSKDKHTIPGVNSDLKFRKRIGKYVAILILSLIPLSAFTQNEPNPILPDTIFLALGNAIELFNDDVAFVQLGNTRYTFDWEYDVGNSDSQKWYWTSDQLGIFNLSFKCYLDGVLVDEESSVLKVDIKAAGKEYFMLTVGNSLTATGFNYQIEQVSQDLDIIIKPIGTLGTTYKHEGHPGWMFVTFVGPESPFYFDGVIDPTQYISANGLETPDIVRISLGINDCLLWNEMGFITSKADELVAAFVKAFPEAIILIAMPTLCENSGDGWLNNYGDLENYERYQFRIRELWEHLLGAYGSGNGPERVHVSYDGLSINRDLGYPKDANGVHNNGVHPRNTGHHQLSRGYSNVINHYLSGPGLPSDTEAPSIPTGLQIVDASESSLNIFWIPSTDNVKVIGYKIYLDGAYYASTGSTNYNITGLQSATSYSISVSAFDASTNESGRSSHVVGETEIYQDVTPPSIPTGLQIVGTTESSLSISWNPSTDNVNVSGYRIYLNGTLYHSTSTTSITISALQPGTSYSIAVSAFDEASNESGRSPPLVGETDISPDTTPPSIPSGLTMVDATESTLSILWNPSSDNVNVAGYNIFVNSTFQYSSSSTSYIISGLEGGTHYSVSVSAFDDSSNESERSPPVVGRTEFSPDTSPPSIPNGLFATEITNISIHLIWNQSSDNFGVAGYGVFLNDIRIDQTDQTSYIFTGLDQASLYALSVSAFDEAGNESIPSNNIQISTTDSIGIYNPPSPEVSILQVSQVNGQVISQSVLRSHGYTELESFGVMIRSANGTIDDAELIYSNPDEWVLSNDGRENDNLQVFYNYSALSGDQVRELVGTDNVSDLIIEPVENTEWLPGQGLKISGNTILYNKEIGARIIKSIKATEEISVENWIKPSHIDQSSPSNILGISEDSTQQFFIQEHLPQEGFYEYGIRLSTNQNDNVGNPRISTEAKIWNTGLQHVLYTRNAVGIENIYLNGELVKSSSRHGSYSSLTGQQQLDICNLHFMDAPWNGTLFLTAIYNRALKASEVQTNYRAGTGLMEYSNEINNLVPGNTYYIYPFAQTDLGMILGDSISLIIDKEDLAPQEDTIIFEVYPNPSSGKFTVRIDENTQFQEPANLRIANLSGQLVYAQNISGSDTFFPNEIELDLTDQLTSGFYSLMLISGSKASAKKLLIQQ